MVTVQFVKMLLDKGANVNAKNTHGKTPLHNAVRCMETEIIGMLLNRKANVNAADDCTVTPLHLAVMNDSKTITQILLNRGANVNGVTSGHRAADKGYLQIV